MDYREAAKAVDSIIDLCSNDDLLNELKDDLFLSAVRYAGIRANWFLAEQESRREMEDERRRAHNALIDACNILSRNMAERERDNTWRAELGDDRKRIGDFACFLHAYLGYLAR